MWRRRENVSACGAYRRKQKKNELANNHKQLNSDPGDDDLQAAGFYAVSPIHLTSN